MCRYLLAKYVNQTVIATSNNAINTENDISISPNPAANICEIKGNLKSSSIQVTSLDGKVYKTLKATENFISIDITNLPEGMFFIKIEDENSIILRKVFKVN